MTTIDKSKMAWVITGATGFLGQTLISKVKNFKNIIAKPLSRSEKKGFIKVADYTNVPIGDAVIHLAENSSRSEVEKMGSEYATHSREMVESLVHQFSGRVFYVSSGTVYGDKSQKPHVETDPVFADDLYTKLKILNEKIVIENGGAVFRISNMFGLRMAESNVLSTILLKAESTSPFVLKSTTPIRDFIHVDDVANFILTHGMNCFGEIYNLSSSAGLSIQEIAKYVLEETNQPDRKIHSEVVDPAPSCIILSNTKAIEDFNWKPKLDLKNYIGEYLSGRKN